MPASLASIPDHFGYALAPIPYSADPDSLGFYPDAVFHEPALDDALADAHCNVALWLNDNMC